MRVWVLLGFLWVGVLSRNPEDTLPRFHQTKAQERTSSGGPRGQVKGGEWWVKDPPWFLPPPPEWGPMPPTMYTSFFHKPRYPSLSTANYYPLYSRTDEYDAHLPASMSRRAAHTQQLIYDNYVANYRDHMHYAPLGDPNVGVSYVDGALSSAGLGEAHGRALSLQHPNNYFPVFSRGGGMNSGRQVSPSYVAGSFPGGLPVFAELKSHSEQKDGQSVTYFASSPVPIFTKRHPDNTNKASA